MLTWGRVGAGVVGIIAVAWAFLSYLGVVWWKLAIGAGVLVLLLVAYVAYLLYLGYKKIRPETVGEIPAPPFTHQILGHPEAMMMPMKHKYRADYCDMHQSAFHQLVYMKRGLMFCNDPTEAAKILNDVPTKGWIYAMFRLTPTVPDIMSCDPGPALDLRIRVLGRGLASLAFSNRASLSADVLAALKNASDAGKTVDLDKLSKQIALDAISSSIFGYKLNAVSDPLEAEGLIKVMATRDDKMKMMNIATSTTARKVPPEEEIQAAERWRAYISKLQGLVVSEALAHEKAKGALEPDNFGHALVLLARELHHENPPENKAELDLASDLNIAAEIHSCVRHGFEAIAGTLAWVFYLLYRNPKIRAKLEQALVVDGPGAGAQAEYLECVVREAMRRNPVMGNFTQRFVTKKGYRVKGGEGGYEVPIQEAEGGSAINVGIFPLQTSATRTPGWGEKAREFLPERWQGAGSKGADGTKASYPNCPFLARGQDPATLAASIARDPRNDVFGGVGFKEDSLSFFPFSAGTRVCKGREFSLEVIRQVVADVCSKYRLDCSAAEELHEDPGVCWFASIVPGIAIPGSTVVSVSVVTNPGELPKTKKAAHRWAADSDDEDQGEGEGKGK